MVAAYRMQRLDAAVHAGQPHLGVGLRTSVGVSPEVRTALLLTVRQGLHLFG